MYNSVYDPSTDGSSRHPLPSHFVLTRDFRLNFCVFDEKDSMGDTRSVHDLLEVYNRGNKK